MSGLAYILNTKSKNSRKLLSTLNQAGYVATPWLSDTKGWNFFLVKTDNGDGLFDLVGSFKGVGCELHWDSSDVEMEMGTQKSEHECEWRRLVEAETEFENKRRELENRKR